VLFQRAVFLAGCKDCFQGQKCVSRGCPTPHPWHCFATPGRATVPRQWAGMLPLLWRCSSGSGVNESWIKAGCRAQRGIQTIPMASRGNTFHTVPLLMWWKELKMTDRGFYLSFWWAFFVWFVYTALGLCGCYCDCCLSSWLFHTNRLCVTLRIID
jgi:hypothetical protein